jgi:hypothetical protein
LTSLSARAYEFVGAWRSAHDTAATGDEPPAHANCDAIAGELAARDKLSAFSSELDAQVQGELESAMSLRTQG